MEWKDKLEEVRKSRINMEWKDKLEEVRKSRDEGYLPFMMRVYAIQKGVPKNKIEEVVAELEKEINELLEQEGGNK